MTTATILRSLSGKGLTLQEAGEIAGVTRERVRQIRNKLGLDIRKRYPPKPKCIKCGRGIAGQNKSGLCCDCLRRSKLVEIICDVCGGTMRHYLSQIRWRQENDARYPNDYWPQRHKKCLLRLTCRKCGDVFDGSIPQRYEFRQGRNVLCQDCTSKPLDYSARPCDVCSTVFVPSRIQLSQSRCGRQKTMSCSPSCAAKMRVITRYGRKP